MLNRTEEVFDQWASSGRHRQLEQEHGFSVGVMLEKLEDTYFGEPFSFLDVGCGNGWVVRRVAANPNCTRAVGVDVSSQMIDAAKQMCNTPKEAYHKTTLEEWSSPPFTVIFSIESLYYAQSMKLMLSKIYSLLEPGGVCVCGTDYYTENVDTAYWGQMLGITMHMHSESEWVKLFTDAGFETKAERIRNAQSTKQWKRNQGTLLINGIRPTL